MKSLLALACATATLVCASSALAQSLDAAPTSAPMATTTAVAPAVAPTTAGSELNPASRFWAVRATAELGVLSVLSHTVTLSQNGTTIDYVREGGQDNVFLFARVGAELELAKHHNISFLYQPIDLRTQARAPRDWLINNTMFARGTAVDLRYGFDFYRASYTYDFFAAPEHELSVGLTLQLRNAAIIFTSADGMLRAVNTNVGIVPALRARGRYTFRSGWFLGFEVDGSYASIPGLNGSDIPVEGALLDGSLRAGLRLWGATELFVNVRYLGGGSRGVGKDPEAPADGYVENWLHTGALSIGANLR